MARPPLPCHGAMRNSARGDSKRLTLSAPAPTIGLLVDCLEDSYQWSVLRGAMDAARDHGARLLCFVGGVLGAPPGEGGERNGVFDLAGPKSVDALIVMSGVIGNRLGPEGLMAFCERYRPLPMCSIAVELGDMSSVCIDNESGMRVAIEHLIRTHDMKRIAFVRGPAANAEAERRFGVYKDVLEKGGIPFVPDLVTMGDFEPSGGREAVRSLLGDGKPPAHELDAIVAANDATALGVLDELASRGIRVPEQLAVVGFDDIEESRFANPSLTTVRQPLYEQGRDAVRIVLEQLRDGARPERVVRRTELVTRRSCGCLAPHAASSRGALTLPTTLGFEAALVERHQVILSAVSRASRGEMSAAGVGWAERLLNAFVEQVRGEAPDAFALAYDDLLGRLSAGDADLSVCNDVLSALRAHSLACFAKDAQRGSRVEDVIHDARVTTADVMDRAQAWRRMRAERRARSLGRAAAAIASAHDVDDLSRAMREHLPRLGITRCYVLTFNAAEGEERQARLALVLTPDARHSEPPSWQLQRVADILRSLVMPGTGEHALAVLPTVSRGEELGVLVLELEAVDGYLYETLRDVFTAALAGARPSSLPV
jgi:sigma-B regulation protein RsbU (phosphoserine phosphatase)